MRIESAIPECMLNFWLNNVTLIYVRGLSDRLSTETRVQNEIVHIEIKW